MKRARRSPGRTVSRRSAASSGTVSSTEGRPLPVVPVILAGGSGTRLWPLARAARPKQFLPLFGGRSLFGLTFERVRPLSATARVMVVAGRGHAGWLRRETPELAAGSLILEAIGRNTAASIALAALRITRGGGDGMMVVVPADHWIRPAGDFRRVIRRAIAVARGTDALVTIGLRPRGPDSGFGYIRLGRRIRGHEAWTASRFVEKPDARRARRMVDAGHWLWNGGIFIWRAGRLLSEMRRHCPAVLLPLERWAQRASRGRWLVPPSVLRRCEATPVDRAVLERSRRVAVVPARFEWSDLGNWAAFADLLPGDRRGNRSVGPLLAYEATGCLAVGDAGPIVMAGLRDVLVIRAGEVTLVCHRDAVQSVRRIVESLRGPLARHA